eukprot:11255255-Alexandrium_andersonii.AAC.1
MVFIASAVVFSSGTVRMLCQVCASFVGAERIRLVLVWGLSGRAFVWRCGMDGSWVLSAGGHGWLEAAAARAWNYVVA